MSPESDSLNPFWTTLTTSFTLRDIVRKLKQKITRAKDKKGNGIFSLHLCRLWFSPLLLKGTLRKLWKKLLPVNEAPWLWILNPCNRRTNSTDTWLLLVETGKVGDFSSLKLITAKYKMITVSPLYPGVTMNIQWEPTTVFRSWVQLLAHVIAHEVVVLSTLAHQWCWGEKGGQPAHWGEQEWG